MEEVDKYFKEEFLQGAEYGKEIKEFYVSNNKALEGANTIGIRDGKGPEGSGKGVQSDSDFYVAPNGKTLPGQYKEWLGTNMRDSLVNSVDDPTLKKAIGEVYRPGSIIGDGGTADIIRFEKETGILLSKSGHTQKAVDMSKYFQKLVDSGTLSPADTQVAQDIIKGLNSALGGK